MVALLKKDFFCIRTYLFKQYALMLVLFCVISLYMDNTSFVGGMLGMVGFMMVISTFSYDESGGFTRFALTMPVDKKQIVGSKYMLALLGLLLALFLNLTLGSALNFINKTPFIEHISASLAVFFMFLFTSAISMPLIFRFGVEKSRMLMMFSYMVPFFLSVFGIGLIKQFDVPMPNEQGLLLLAIGAAAFIALFFIASYFLSIKLFRKKDI